MKAKIAKGVPAQNSLIFLHSGNSLSIHGQAIFPAGRAYFPKVIWEAVS